MTRDPGAVASTLSSYSSISHNSISPCDLEARPAAHNSCPSITLVEQQPQSRRWLRVLADLLMICIAFLNLWFSTALLTMLFRPPTSLTLSDWLATDPPEAAKLSSKCLSSNYRERRVLLTMAGAVFMSFSFIQGASIALAFNIGRKADCLALSCAVAVAGATLILIGFQIYLARQWMLSPCDYTPLNSLEVNLTLVKLWAVYRCWLRVPSFHS
eukprot:Protomagalhaensia_sp_Gyna_25__627@NODE_1295_length_1969_cov_287_054404_g1034_i0_p1_GENE_NODE_1295_length_1969_cov_287_054404_g1034_i0NODE_1295_length_1969_cov_287_054404_g1034_i0_p1_ORF_typecomplete_len214_score13_70DUF5009/PF16401_5/1_4e03DUF5009/PF16401_5/0_091DUF1624/PF07786_12/0_34DUF202/PF02656_15/75_NODE_1295_length_1969_cov_287_054404_g1034_i058699